MSAIAPYKACAHFTFIVYHHNRKQINVTGMNKIATIAPSTFSKKEPYVCLSIISQNGKYGLVDSTGHVVCPCICESIKFGMPFCIAQINYQGVEFIMDRYHDYCTFLFFWEEWCITHNPYIPSLLTLASWELFVDHNKRLGCDMNEDYMKILYDEFVYIIKEHNKTITREEILDMTNNVEVREYFDKLSSLHSEQ